MNRRQFAGGAGSISLLALSGCTSFISSKAKEERTSRKVTDSYTAMYGPVNNEQFPISAVNLDKIPHHYLRREVEYTGPHPAGTLIVNTNTFYLHLVQEGGRAMRYGVGLGRAGFEWSGRGVIKWKQAWPKWTPPDEMIARQPELEKWSARNGGMPPGPDNPLGARALYIFQGGKDTLYRIHGSPEYWTIGKAVSSGCVRLMNQDVIDLYNRVPNGSTLIVA